MIRLIKQNGQDIRQLLLGDFGFATEDTSCLTGLCGTDGYIAPEVLNGLPYSKAADMWSVGCCLYWIVTGWHPFHERLVGKQSLTEAVTSGLFHPGRLEKAGRSCRAVVELIEGLLCPIPEQRLTAEDALKSPFFGRPPQEAILEARTRY
jgi:RAC serine/threonine-protein kinase/non-specific serine/threonine protein kinase/protein-serine/threonine kinase